MIWKKLGRIFNPAEHILGNNAKLFAQSPQTIEFEHFIRIYFSSRSSDCHGQFLSQINYIEMDKEFQTILFVSDHTVIELGRPGTFDEHGIFPINLLKGGDGIIRAYTCGWSRRVSVPVETSTGLAFSYDGGKSFSKYGSGPVFSSSLHEPFLVGDSFVMYHNDVYYMWYIYGFEWLEQTQDATPSRVYKIAFAKSENGIDWIERNGKQIIEDKLDRFECQALPSVLYNEGVFHMVFCYRHATDFRTNRNRGYRLGYASSTDLVNWTRNDEVLKDLTMTEGAWDGDMMCYPHIFKCDGKIYLLYNGNEFGKYGFGLAQLL
jgi:hypothetical protein